MLLSLAVADADLISCCRNLALALPGCRARSRRELKNAHCRCCRLLPRHRGESVAALAAARPWRTSGK